MNFNSECEELMNSWTTGLQQEAFLNRFPYIFTKAKSFLQNGIEKYKKEDFFKEPNISSEEVHDLLKEGCKQVIQGRGLTPEMPFCDLGVQGFNALMRTFHFSYSSRQTSHNIFYNGQKGHLDKITWKHIVDHSEVVYYNFCLSVTLDESFLDELLAD